MRARPFPLALVPLLLLPAVALADAGDYHLLGEGLVAPSAASALGLHEDVPERAGLASGGSAPSWRMQGSAAKLEGLICVAHVFVEDSDSTWSDYRRKRVREEARAGMDRLRGIAKQRGIAIRWQEREYSFASEDEISIASGEHSWTKAAVQSSVAKLGVYLPIASCPVHECDEQLALLHLAKAGRSYALPSIFSYDGEIERAVMFMRAGTTPLSDSAEASMQPGALVPELPASFIHEILHLFGAEDLYQPEARLRAAALRYPKDVMLQSHRSLESVEISEYTSYLIGWSDRQPPALPLVD